MKITVGVVVCLAGWLAGPAVVVAQEALERPAWIERPEYYLVYPKRFDASEISNMFVELPHLPLKAGESKSSARAMMFPRRPQSAAPAPVQGPEQYLETPFGPVASGLQRPVQAAVRPKGRVSRRVPLGW
jgi:hypothetical protein